MGRSSCKIKPRSTCPKNGPKVLQLCSKIAGEEALARLSPDPPGSKIAGQMCWDIHAWNTVLLVCCRLVCMCHIIICLHEDAIALVCVPCQYSFPYEVAEEAQLCNILSHQGATWYNVFLWSAHYAWMNRLHSLRWILLVQVMDSRCMCRYITW